MKKVFTIAIIVAMLIMSFTPTAMASSTGDEVLSVINDTAFIETQRTLDAQISMVFKNVKMLEKNEIDGDDLYNKYCAVMDTFLAENQYYAKMIENATPSFYTIESASVLDYAFWSAGATFLYASGNSIASMCLRHSIDGRGLNIGFSTTSDTARRVQSNTNYSSVANNNLNQYIANPNPNPKIVNTSFRFVKSVSTDLYWALNAVSMRMEMGRIANNPTNLYFKNTVSDVYNFHGNGDYSGTEVYGGISGALVSKAYESQLAGIIVPYGINIYNEGTIQNNRIIYY